MGGYEHTGHGCYPIVAKRIGRVIEQYDKLETDDDKYPSSLDVVALQFLTSFYKELRRGEKDVINEKAKRAVLLQGCLPQGFSFEEFIVILRNSMSHPRGNNEVLDESRTGYFVVNQKDRVFEVVFNDSYIENGSVMLKTNELRILVMFLSQALGEVGTINKGTGQNGDKNGRREKSA